MRGKGRIEYNFGLLNILLVVSQESGPLYMKAICKYAQYMEAVPVIFAK